MKYTPIKHIYVDINRNRLLFITLFQIQIGLDNNCKIVNKLKLKNEVINY